ncbi:hypothetical protein BH10ACI2_BH10ACI2_15410 [soil metagenome]
MPEAPKNKPDEDEAVPPEKNTWSEDQKERGYYYDDSHGYEVYKPEDDADDCDVEPE